MGVDWRGTAQSLSELLSSLCREPPLIRDSFTDVTIILPDETQVRAHKFILVLASPRFEAHFCGPWADKANADTFTVKDVSSKTFRTFLDFIYNPGKLENLDIDDYWSLLEAGHLYIHKGLIKHCTQILGKHIKELEASEEMVDFINRAANLSIYDDLVVVATKSIVQKMTHYFQAGLLDKLNKSSLEKIRTEIATSSWVGDADSYLFIQDRLTFEYNHYPDDFKDVVNHCKTKLFNILKSKSSKKSFIQMIEDNLIYDDYEKLDDEVMERLKDHLKSQSWKELCDNGNAFINVVNYLREEENIGIDGELWFAYLPELDDEDAIDWVGTVSHMYKDENSWWNLLFYARTFNLPNLEEYCRSQLLICIFLAHLNTTSSFT